MCKYALCFALLLTCLARQSAQAEGRQKIPLQYYDLTEIRLLATQPAHKGGYAVFADPQGFKHRIKQGGTVAAGEVEILSIHRNTVVLGHLVDREEGWHVEPTHDWQVGNVPTQRTNIRTPAQGDSDLLNPDQWPLTLDEAVRMTLDEMSKENQQAFAASKREDLPKFHLGFGTYLRNRFGLWRGNTKLILSACGKPCHPDNASSAIISSVWNALQRAEPKTR